MKIKNVLLIVGVIAILTLIKILFLSPKKAQSGKSSNKTPSTALIKAAIVKSAFMNNEITTSGSIIANEEVNLKPEIAGKIISIKFAEGREVKKGQLLVKINDSDIKAAFEKQKAILRINEEREKNLKALLAIKGVSQEEYDIAQSQVEQVRADLEVIKAQIDKTEIRAPFDGTIGLKYFSEGDFVTAADIIASIQQLNPLKIDFGIPEKYSSQVHIKDTVRVKVAGSSKSYFGEVYAIDPKIDASTRTLKVRAMLENKTHEIFAGSYADVSLLLNSENALVVPSMAVVNDLRGHTTYLVKNGQATLNPVTIGIRTDSTVEILSGLKIGDTIAIGGFMGLKPGTMVKIQNLKSLK